MAVHQRLVRLIQGLSSPCHRGLVLLRLARGFVNLVRLDGMTASLRRFYSGFTSAPGADNKILEQYALSNKLSSVRSRPCSLTHVLHFIRRGQEQIQDETVADEFGYVLLLLRRVSCQGPESRRTLFPHLLIENLWHQDRNIFSLFGCVI